VFLMYGAVGFGGIIGAMLREVLELLIPVTSGFPLPTLVINWTGSLFLAWFYTITTWRLGMPAWLRAGVGTGIVGAFTTFSTFSLETDTLLQTGKLLEAALYVALSVAGGLFLAWLGFRLGSERVVRVRQEEEPSD
jgi:CrcB protein